MHVRTMKTVVLCFVSLVIQSSLALPHYGDDSKVYVHIVPHTHDDVGWLKTVDEYYYGANKTEQRDAAVQYILDTVVQELQLNENRTFIYVEIAFFSRWWNEQDEPTKNIVKQLVAKKQLEFVNAGWCMNDEASTHYNAIIDQMTLGLQFVEENFGADARPRVAWHIDPFGHSNAMASLLAQMGYDAFFFARNDYNDYQIRVNHSTLQMVWRPSDIEGVDTDIFTGILYNGYGPPHGFCFDHRCEDEPVQDNPDLLGYNVDELVDKFIAAIYDQKKHYLTNHIMLTMGSDFQYENAREWFKNLDKIMKYTMKKNSSIELFYSTPSRYIDALHKANLKWTVKTDDFFPYADTPYSYWTGYFTSRPALKGYVRELNGVLQVCKQMDAFSQILNLTRKTSSTTRRLKEAMGVSQHHDAVSGTERQHVADDYAFRLHRGSTECQALVEDVIGSVLTSGGSASTAAAPEMVFCEYLNVSICPEIEKERSFNVLVYNPLLIPAPLMLWIPLSADVATTPLTVEDDQGQTIPSQIQTISLAVQNAKRKRGAAEYELAIGDTLPPLSFKTYFIRPLTNSSSTKKPVSIAKETNINNEHDDIIIGTQPMQVTIDGETGRVKAINNTVSKMSALLDQQFRWYESSTGYNINNTQASGAYIFRPNGTASKYFVWAFQVHDQTIVKGDLYTEYRQQFNETSFQTVRVYNHLPYVEFDFVVGPIYKKDSVGKEVVSVFSTNMQTDGTWYTDANGREMQTRIRNYRPTWKLNSTEPVSQNYYPVNSRIFMKDVQHNMQFTVFTDRSQGGTSLNDGQLELMIHRRTFQDDHRGVAEPINEPGQFGDGLIIRGHHYVLFDSIDKSSQINRTLGEHFMLKPYPIFILNQDNAADYKKKFVTNRSFLNPKPKQLPSNVHLLTFEVMAKDKYLIRLENFQESGAPANVTLSNLFVFDIKSVVEMVLGGNANTPIERMRWDTVTMSNHGRGMKARAPIKGPEFSVALGPLEIRTFQVSILQ